RGRARSTATAGLPAPGSAGARASWPALRPARRRTAGEAARRPEPRRPRQQLAEPGREVPLVPHPVLVAVELPEHGVGRPVPRLPRERTALAAGPLPKRVG